MGMFESFQELRSNSKIDRYRERIAESTAESVPQHSYLPKKRPLRAKIDSAMGVMGIEEEDHRSARESKKSCRAIFTHRCKRIKRAPWFNQCIVALIVVVGILAGVEADHANRCSRSRQRYEGDMNDDGEAERSSVCNSFEIFHVATIVAQMFFVAEAVIKLLAEGDRPMRYFSDRQV